MCLAIDVLLFGQLVWLLAVQMAWIPSGLPVCGSMGWGHFGLAATLPRLTRVPNVSAIGT